MGKVAFDAEPGRKLFMLGILGSVVQRERRPMCLKLLCIVPSIVLMKIKYLYLHKRISLSFEDTFHKIESCANILVFPLDLFVASVAPTTLDIHDAIIVGTARQAVEEFGQPAALVTIDGAITKSKLVPIIW